MSIFNKFSVGAKNFSEGAKFLSRKSGRLLEVTKTKLEILKLEKEMDNNFRALGSLQYRKFLGSLDLDDEIHRLCKATHKLEQDILELKEETAKYETQQSICKNCGRSTPLHANFCPACGESTGQPPEPL